MKNLTAQISLIATVLMLTLSCNDDLPVVHYPETPVVFGILNKTDSVHYVKITHSFAGYNNAAEVALIPDSSYYSDIVVKVEEYLPLSSDYTNLMKVRSWTLRDTLLNGKEPGTFYGPEQKVYYFKTDAFESSNIPPDYDADPNLALKQSALYKLVAVVNGGEYTISGETRLVNQFPILAPAGNVALSFCLTSAETTTYTPGVFIVGHNGDEYDPAILQASVNVFFNEFANNVPTEKSFNFNFASKYTSGVQSSFSIPGQTFYQKMKETVTNNPSITKRQLTRIQITATGASKTLADYILLGAPTTSFENGEDFFTNVTVSDGRRAIGVFTSSFTRTYIKPDWTPANPAYRAITPTSVKALCTGIITGNLLFCSDNPLDASLSYSCQ